MSLLDYERRFSQLRMNTYGGGEKSPHKVAMLLSVIHLIQEDKITDNVIRFDSVLLDRYRIEFIKIAAEADRENPHLPFFHLRSGGFWHHKIRMGQRQSYTTLKTVSGPGTVKQHIEYVFLDEELFELLHNEVARNLLIAALHNNLSTTQREALLAQGNGWNWIECECIVQDYFVMLQKELAGQPFNKSRHRRELLNKVSERSEGAIEFKHQNISAILVELGQPYIQGYRPAFNYQSQLRDVVLAYIAGHQPAFVTLAEVGDEPAKEPQTVIDWEKVYDPEVPERIAPIQVPDRNFTGRHINFSEREMRNRSLGEQGEKFILAFEQSRMQRLGREDLVDEVEWVSKTRGDGLGYDIRSFDPRRDEELFIEVKTTRSGKYQPFYLSDNELAFSKLYCEQYSLYRVYDFRSSARVFELSGAVDQHVALRPSSYRATFSN
ncbi:MAG: hypothetical protein C9356_18780 [Oleiphilus sp.]|nr:MAG: hypothetical protein C9356_18780 [Oleiphilus sp.]